MSHSFWHRGQLIKQYLKSGQFVYSIHCDRTAEERVVTDEDIRTVGRTAHTAKLQPSGAYKVIGYDESDLELTVICRLATKANLLIITVY